MKDEWSINDNMLVTQKLTKISNLHHFWKSFAVSSGAIRPVSKTVTCQCSSSIAWLKDAGYNAPVQIITELSVGFLTELIWHRLLPKYYAVIALYLYHSVSHAVFITAFRWNCYCWSKWFSESVVSFDFQLPYRVKDRPQRCDIICLAFDSRSVTKDATFRCFTSSIICTKIDNARLTQRCRGSRPPFASSWLIHYWLWVPFTYAAAILIALCED